MGLSRVSFTLDRRLRASGLHDGECVCYPFSGGMDRLTADAIEKIERIHSRWIEFEIAGEHHRLVELCASDIELWPPDAPPVRGRSAVSEHMAQGTSKIQRVETTERRIRGSNETAYLTANYETTFSTMDDPNPRRALGSHLWILRRQADLWLVALVSWSTWGRAATS